MFKMSPSYRKPSKQCHLWSDSVRSCDESIGCTKAFATRDERRITKLYEY